MTIILIILFLIAVFILYIILALIYDGAVGFGAEAAYQRILEDLRHDGWNEYAIHALIDEIDTGETEYVASGLKRLSDGNELLNTYDFWGDPERLEKREEEIERRKERKERRNVTGD